MFVNTTCFIPAPPNYIALHVLPIDEMDSPSLFVASQKTMSHYLTSIMCYRRWELGGLQLKKRYHIQHGIHKSDPSR